MQKGPNSTFRRNLRVAKQLWPGQLNSQLVERLKVLSMEHRFSLSSGDLLLLSSGWYVTHTGLLGMAHRRKCKGIHVKALPEFSNPSEQRWVVKAVVVTGRDSDAFAGYGDADPSNVSPLVRGCELRIAETRAVNRALRKAYGIGICSVEELANIDQIMAGPSKVPASSANGNGSQVRPSVRDQLCALIRKHRLDADLVKRYAADFCGTETLRNASRDLVQDFVKRLSEEAEGDKPALLCRLNSYSDRQVSVS
jgi:hypothetical protein